MCNTFIAEQGGSCPMPQISFNAKTLLTQKLAIRYFSWRFMNWPGADCAAVAAAVRKCERKEVGSWTWFMNEIPQIALHKNPV